jgi:hypothetical protein
MLRIKSDPQTSVLTSAQSFVPLKRVNVEATIRSFAADVTITQVFRNDETKPIEAVYCFPIEEQAAIYSFTARIDDREIIAQLKEKKEAQQEYNNALQQGHGAYLLEQDENSQDNFIINVGALPPSKECTITIAYVTELDFVQGSTIRFVVPTTIAPRYNPDKGGVASPAGTNSKYVQSSPYTIEFRCRVDKMNRSQEEYIARINSPSHPIQIDFAQQDAYVITFAQQNTHLDRDILINIELADKRVNTIVAVEPGAVMAAFTPNEEDCRQGLNNDQVNEFIFVVDCSGSMQDENKIGLARQAMLVFLKSLPVDCQFNIIRFGSQYKSLFTDITAVYNEENAKKAEKLITDMTADLGGTELVSICISSVFLYRFILNIYRCVHFNGLNSIHQIKVVLVKYFFSRMEKYQMLPKCSICAVQWLHLLESFRLDWENHPADRWSKVSHDQPMVDLFSFHPIQVSMYM